MREDAPSFATYASSASRPVGEGVIATPPVWSACVENRDRRARLSVENRDDAEHPAVIVRFVIGRRVHERRDELRLADEHRGDVRDLRAVRERRGRSETRRVVRERLRYRRRRRARPLRQVDGVDRGRRVGRRGEREARVLAAIEAPRERHGGTQHQRFALHRRERRVEAHVGRRRPVRADAARAAHARRDEQAEPVAARAHFDRASAREIERRARGERRGRVGELRDLHRAANAIALVRVLPEDHRARRARHDRHERGRARVGQRVVRRDELSLRVEAGEDELRIHARAVRPREDERALRGRDKIHVGADAPRDGRRPGDDARLGVELDLGELASRHDAQRGAARVRDRLPRARRTRDAARNAARTTRRVEGLREHVGAAGRAFLGPHAERAARSPHRFDPNDVTGRARELDRARARRAAVADAHEAQRVTAIGERRPRDEVALVDAAHDERARVGRRLRDDPRLRARRAVGGERHRDHRARRAASHARHVDGERAVLAAREERTERAILEPRDGRHVRRFRRVFRRLDELRGRPLDGRERRPVLRPGAPGDQNQNEGETFQGTSTIESAAMAG